KNARATIEETAAEFRNFRAPGTISTDFTPRALDRRDQRFHDVSEQLKISERQKELDERRLYLADEILIKNNDYILSLQEAQT
ncbi:hypothetical protein C4K41_27995, partial [Escherichia coli]|uniref:hypothetical protein n=1 Tax=Escherichia coli TaxID=562 RepID=UPI000D40004C